MCCNLEVSIFQLFMSEVERRLQYIWQILCLFWSTACRGFLIFSILGILHLEYIIQRINALSKYFPPCEASITTTQEDAYGDNPDLIPLCSRQKHAFSHKMIASSKKFAFEELSTKVASPLIIIRFTIGLDVFTHYRIVITSPSICSDQNRYCPASPEKEDQRAAGSPAALTQLALCLRLAPILRPKADNARNPQWLDPTMKIMWSTSVAYPTSLLRWSHHRQVKLVLYKINITIDTHNIIINLTLLIKR